jgi:hypothetical protein
MYFFGDALFPDGNNYPLRSAGALAIQVRDPEKTWRVIEAVIASLGRAVEQWTEAPR